ncbi:transcription initiation factor TFIID subunit A-domain-containing protein [Amylocystis lapponica]|nr:transcription initiation factor TFIID subunit A-domain-containing protein [Amylocystis lapponica]
MAQNQQQPPAVPPNPAAANNIITALGNAFKTQTGDPVSGDRIAQLLIQNMSQLGELAKQGKLNQAQILQLKEYADKHKASAMNGTGASMSAQGAPMAQQAPLQAPTAIPPANPAFKTSNPSPFLSASSPTDTYPISSTPNINNPGPVPWQSAHQGRPTLTGGIPSGRVSGTPAQIQRAGEDSLTMEDNRTRRKNSPGDQSMRRTIQDLVSSIDPNVKVEPEVEELLLDIADEFIDSVTNFGCRLAKHRGGDTLEVKDLQLHLERNHNIRIPGFASDETRISMSQTATAPAAAAAPANKKGAQGTQSTMRAQRLAQLQAAKKEAKLV